MSERKVTIQLPDSLYQRLNDVAQASGWKLEEVVIQSVRSGMPPSLTKVPGKYHAQLLALNKLDDQALWEAGQGEWHDSEATAAENADLELLHRAYAFALLKWRGHPLPDPNDFLL
jgi:hypothetical protein